MTYLLLVLCLLATAEACMRVEPPSPGMPSGCPGKCADSLITKTVNTPESHPMDGDSKDNTCTKRTFVCKGPSAAIGVNEPGDGEFQDGDDGTVDNVANFQVTCNAALTPPAWQYMGQTVTKVDCAAGRTTACACPKELIQVVQESAISKMMEGDITDGACTMRTFVCEGTQPTIAINGQGMGEWGDDDDDMPGDGKATFKVTCNTAVMPPRWEYMNTVITKVDCTAVPPPGPCADNLIMVVQETNTPDSMSIQMTGDKKDLNGNRIFTCGGPGANNPIIIIDGNGQWQDVDDGTVDNVATFTVSCNAAVPQWEFMGAAVNKVDCTITP